MLILFICSWLVACGIPSDICHSALDVFAVTRAHAWSLAAATTNTVCVLVKSRAPALPHLEIARGANLLGCTYFIVNRMLREIIALAEIKVEFGGREVTKNF